MEPKEEYYEMDAVEMLKYRRFLGTLMHTALGRIGEFSVPDLPTPDTDEDKWYFDCRTVIINKKIAKGCREIIRSIDEKLGEH